MTHGDRGAPGDHGASEDKLREAGVTRRIIGCAIKVHRTLGAGLLEHVYEDCLGFELRRAGFEVQRQVVLPLVYEGIRFPRAYKADIMVDQNVIIEVKSVDQIMPVHESQLLTYLRFSGCQIGLLLNFNAPILKDGIRRVIL